MHPPAIDLTALTNCKERNRLPQRAIKLTWAICQPLRLKALRSDDGLPCVSEDTAGHSLFILQFGFASLLAFPLLRSCNQLIDMRDELPHAVFTCRIVPALKLGTDALQLDKRLIGKLC